MEVGGCVVIAGLLLFLVLFLYVFLFLCRCLFRVRFLFLCLLRVFLRTIFLIVGGLYWVTALRKTGGEVKVYTKHQDLTQASKHHKQIMCR